MGNEKSALNGLEIDDKSVEITDFWIHYTARVKGYNPRKVSIFISEPSLHYGASFGKPSPLEKAAKNLMLHRHPCILRYISSWSKGSKFFLTTERARPLIQVIETQNSLQICIGLYSVVRALAFLHEKAHASHNNVCMSSIYVTPEGCWKLGGLEYLCKSSDLTSSYLLKIKNYRYDRAIPPDEHLTIASAKFTAIDAYAFGILAEDILKLKNSEDVPGLAEFKEFCRENLQNPDFQLRQELSAVLRHTFFTHDFMQIQAFLEELPLKYDTEKETFFENLVIQLKAFPENVVAEQLGRLLLSRIVLLDSTAQKKLLPFVLKPRDEKDDVETSLFTIPTFKIFLVPKLLQMFCIRDASIRLVLLAHFNSFVHMFQADELKTQILPELLVGIKDTNDHLVCATLRALADIVPILGAATVIGGNRGKLFTDGRPNKAKETANSHSIAASFENIVEFTVPAVRSVPQINLPERPSPDGGEDKREAGFTFTEEECTWSDWEAQETAVENVQDDLSQPTTICQPTETALDSALSSTDSSVNVEKNKLVDSKIAKKQSTLSDIAELDVKNSKSISSAREEFDFFTDMEPVIKKTQVLHVQETPGKSMFDVKTFSNGLEGADENCGWDEGLSDWGTDDTQDLKI